MAQETVLINKCAHVQIRDRQFKLRCTNKSNRACQEFIKKKSRVKLIWILSEWFVRMRRLIA
jgi:hypothetical protein